jgi:hypothetical protein
LLALSPCRIDFSEPRRQQNGIVDTRRHQFLKNGRDHIWWDHDKGQINRFANIGNTSNGWLPVDRLTARIDVIQFPRKVPASQVCMGQEGPEGFL